MLSPMQQNYRPNKTQRKAEEGNGKLTEQRGIQSAQAEAGAELAMEGVSVLVFKGFVFMVFGIPIRVGKVYSVMPICWLMRGRHDWSAAKGPAEGGRPEKRPFIG